MKNEKNLARLYNYLVVNLSNNVETGFKAVIPKFPHLYVFADNPDELHKIVLKSIEDEIRYLRNSQKSLPSPDISKYSGKFVLRISPDLHERLVFLSKANGKTLNQFLISLLEKQVLERK